MAKLNIGEKAERALKFFLGLRNPRIVAALAAHGFSKEDLDEGWAALRAVTRSKLDVVHGGTPSADPEALTLLDEWENKWFPIAAATLARRAPEAHGWMFRNLVQTEGAAVITSVSTFLERVSLLTRPKKEGGLGAGGAEARKLLEKRGLTAKVIAEAEALLERLRNTAVPGEEAITEDEAEQETAAFAAAEEHLWGWYLEWSVIARRVVKTRSLLKQLGFLQGGALDREEPTDPTPDTAKSGGEISGAPDPK